MSHVRDHDLLTVGEYARHLSVSPQTVRRWIQQGHLPAVKVGPRLWRIEPDAELPTIPSGRRGYSHPTTDRIR